MSWRDIVAAQLQAQEGDRRFPYMDTAGKSTIGRGRNLTDKGIRQDEIEFLFAHDLADAEYDARMWLGSPCFDGLSDNRKAVVVNMAFNLGLPRLRTFVKFLAALQDGEYHDAAAQMLDSVWATEVGQRATMLAALMESG